MSVYLSAEHVDDIEQMCADGDYALGEKIPALIASYRALGLDYNVLLDTIAEAVKVIEGLVDQQAMPDDWFEEPLAHFKRIVENVDKVDFASEQT